MAKSRLTKRQRKRLQKTLAALSPPPAARPRLTVTQLGQYAIEDGAILEKLRRLGFNPFNEEGEKRLLAAARKLGMYGTD